MNTPVVNPIAPPPGTLAAALGKPAPKPSDSYVQSFARGLEVLRSFGEHASTQTLSEAAARTGLTRAGARRILLTLQQLGYVSAEGRHFRLTPKVLELGFAYLSSQPLWHLAQPAMEELVEKIHESCSVAMLDGDDIVYVLRVPARKIMSITLGVGSRLPAYCTAMGRVLLADLPEPSWGERLSHMQLTPHTSHTVTDPVELANILRQVRHQGYAVVVGELEEGLVSIAAPIVNRAGRVIAAINMSGQLTRTPPQRMVEAMLPELQDTARRINSLIRAHE